VPIEVVLDNVSNEVSWDTISHLFRDWKFYDNQGAAPKLVATKASTTDP